MEEKVSIKLFQKRAILLQKEGGPLWDKYQDLQNNRGRLTRMNLDNRQASYTRCILESRTPDVYYNPEKDTGWYAGYNFIDMNNDHFDFNLSLSKKF